MDSWFFLSFSPLSCFFLWRRDPKRAKNRRGNGLRLIQIRLATLSLEKILPAVYTTLVYQVRSYTPSQQPFT